ncbi:urea transporter [Brevibacillus fluminis]|uniref:Urea transporter n=1 Tax=Brevibacillus fluminis TaxID=511487 RepID=A0A3M8DGC7_9BACL|nr:urea transporter [Brevibacillus fluminis]RNB87152.1 urea transporter [Brevibacillus fluminis]
MGIRHVFIHGLSGIAQSVFFRKPLAGGIFLCAFLLYSPLLAFACLVGTIAANGTASLSKRPQATIVEGLYGYNGALLGLAFATFLPHDWLLWACIVFTAGLSVFLYDLFQRFGIPPYTMPYVALAWVVLAIIRPDLGAASASAFNWTIPLTGMGQIFFLPSALGGLLILVGLATACPPRQLVLTFVGAAIGCLPFAWLGEAPYLTAGLISTNAALSALGILQVKTRYPALLSICFALGSALLYPFLSALLGTVGLPALTFPFIATMWVGRSLMAFIEKRKRGVGQVVSS